MCWVVWITLALLVTCAYGENGESSTARAATVPPVTPSRAPPRTLDRKAAELAWHSWLQSAESRDPAAPPRRITTKSLFITPLICKSGQRLDRDGCVQVVTVNKDEHERYLLEQLNALFTASPGSFDEQYDYEDEEHGPLQLSIPISLEPQAASLLGQEPSAQGQEFQPTYTKLDIKENGEKIDTIGIGIEAELELLKLQNMQNDKNYAELTQATGLQSHKFINSLLPKQDTKRDSNNLNVTEQVSTNTEKGQKEEIFGDVNIDPIEYLSDIQTLLNYSSSNNDTSTVADNKENESTDIQIIEEATIPTNIESQNPSELKKTNENDDNRNMTENNDQKITINQNKHDLIQEADKTKLNPENDYSDIGETIKLISRYAEVTTDDNYANDLKKHANKDDSILGTRTKIQHRRKPTAPATYNTQHYKSQGNVYSDKVPPNSFYPKNENYYRYPLPNIHKIIPPAGYPFRHIQDYWPGRIHPGGVYNPVHENPRRHHHSYPHTPQRFHGFPGLYAAQPGGHNLYAQQQMKYLPSRVGQHYVNPQLLQAPNDDVYSLVGLRHWFSSEAGSKR